MVNDDDGVYMHEHIKCSRGINEYLHAIFDRSRKYPTSETNAPFNWERVILSKTKDGRILL